MNIDCKNVDHVFVLVEYLDRPARNNRCTSMHNVALKY